MNQNETATDEQQETQPSTAARLVQIAGRITLFRTPGGEAYANIPIEGGYKTVPVQSAAMRSWLRWQYGKAEYGVPNKTAIEAACDQLASNAEYEGATEQVYVRLAWRSDEQAIYLNLGPTAGVLRVTAEGWDECDEAPVRFRWPNGALPLPKPARGGKLDDLRDFLNLDSEDDWVLLVSFLIGMYHPTGPYPTLHLLGEKGCAKSSTSRYLRSLFDPHEAQAVKSPKDAEAVMLKATSNAVVAFDNLSYMPQWLSDLVCQINTGAADSKRTLYANTDETIMSAKRPVILNGIGEIVSAGDLLDRLISVQLPVIPPQQRRTEAELNNAFAAAQPRILGALLDVVSAALRNRDQVQLAEKPRMADFAVWVTAAEGALGWEPGTFLKAYLRNEDTGAAVEIEQSLVAQAVLDFMRKQRARGEPTYEAPAELLLDNLQECVSESFTRRQGWPKTAASLSYRLLRVAGALRKQGLDVVKDRDGKKGRSITLRWIEEGELDPTGNDGSDGDDALSANPPNSSPKQEKREEGQGGGGYAAQTASPASQASRHQSCSHPASERFMTPKRRLACGVCFLYLDLDRRPSEKQMKMLSDHGYTPEQVAGLAFREWKSVLDALFAKAEPEIAPEGKKAAPKPADEQDLPWDSPTRVRVDPADCAHLTDDRTTFDDGTQWCAACFQWFDAQGQPVTHAADVDPEELPF